MMSATNHAVVVLIAVLLTGVSLHSASITQMPAHQTEATTVSLTLTGYAFAGGYTPAGWVNPLGAANPTITVTQGDAVSLTLMSGDGLPHQFYVDVDHNRVPDCSTADPCSKMIPPSATFTFTVSFAAGTYTYYCSLHPFSMFGTFIVNVPPSPASFVHGKLHWTHHLSLVKNMGMQTFTAVVLDTGSSSTIAIVHVRGTGSVASFSADSNPTPLSPGVVRDITFPSTGLAGFVGTKVCFTASLTFGPTGTEQTSSVTKTGCFAVVP